MEGGTLWIDDAPPRLPSYLNGIGLEVEARDINIGHDPSNPATFVWILQVGILYTWPRFHSIHPYAKSLVNLGGIDWNNPDRLFRH